MPDKNPKNKVKQKKIAVVNHEVNQDRKHESPTAKNEKNKNGTGKVTDKK